MTDSSQNDRYLIAIDGKEVFLRGTLCVTHHGERPGGITYDAQHIDPKDAPEWLQTIHRGIVDYVNMISRKNIKQSPKGKERFVNDRQPR